jgi:hypothetical protein
MQPTNTGPREIGPGQRSFQGKFRKPHRWDNAPTTRRKFGGAAPGKGH